MPDKKDNNKDSHSLDDHVMGTDFNHSHHGIGADHDHDVIELGPLEQNPIWIQDHVTLTSVGIDIGSSGTQVIFSRINLRRLGEDLSSRYFVVSRETLYQSPVALTPYRSQEQIDQLVLGEIIDDAYNQAGISPADIDTGAVILTGEALRRHNAEAISAILSEQGGEFVCATAGHHMESMLAAFGSGAARISVETGIRILNIDIGGGTTKLAIVQNGQVIQSAALHLGGRLQVVDSDNRITRLEPAGYKHALRAGFDWSLGQKIERIEMENVAETMADRLINILLDNASQQEIEDLYLTDPISSFSQIGGVLFSGGVAEYVYQREEQDFGDMGKLLGTAIRAKIEANKITLPLLPAGECIRATALGASEYSVQLSGNTIYISNRSALLPRKNLQVLQPNYVFEKHINSELLAEAISTHIKSFDIQEGDQEIALAFRWQGDPSHQRVSAFAKGIVQALPNSVKNSTALYIVLDGDLAQTLGNLLKTELKLNNEILVIDGVMLTDFDYIDLGKIRMPSFTVPVSVKSLVFNDNMGNSISAEQDADRHGHQHNHSNHQGHKHNG